MLQTPTAMADMAPSDAQRIAVARAAIADALNPLIDAAGADGQAAITACAAAITGAAIQAGNDIDARSLAGTSNAAALICSSVPMSYGAAIGAAEAKGDPV